jgi:putative DNA-invertase from lambdoid prophage Rac
MVIKAAIYARVSTTDQNCEMQLAELRGYCFRRGWEVYAEYVDTGWSGATASRPQLDQLMKDARERRFDAVVVWKLDRWGRSLIQSVQSIQELASIGVRFLAVTQNIDTGDDNPMARFLLNIFASFAEFEREMIRERVACGLRAARAKGKSLGRPKRVFRRDEALRLRVEGKSWRAISKELGIPVSTLKDGCTESLSPAVTNRDRKHSTKPAAA